MTRMEDAAATQRKSGRYEDRQSTRTHNMSHLEITGYRVYVIVDDGSGGLVESSLELEAVGGSLTSASWHSTAPTSLY